MTLTGRHRRGSAGEQEATKGWSSRLLPFSLQPSRFPQDSEFNDRLRWPLLTPLARWPSPVSRICCPRACEGQRDQRAGLTFEPAPVSYDYYSGADYPHTTTYHQPAPQWTSTPSHPATTPASWGEFAPAVGHHQFPASSSRSSVVELSYNPQSSHSGASEHEWNRRYSEGAAARERPGSGIPRPTSAAPSTLANFSWQATASNQSSSIQATSTDRWQTTRPVAVPVSPTFGSASPTLHPLAVAPVQSPPFQPQTYHSSPPPVFSSASPPTPTRPQAFIAHPPNFSHTSVAPHPSSRPSKSPPSTTSPSQKRGRRPKNYVKTAEDERIEREEYLERNRLAALKSRQRKKERMGNLEQQAKEYCSHNDSLQKYALTLQSELLHLRSILSQLGGQSFPDVDGYLEREAKGGGIPTILRIAGATLERDYQAVARV